jgi:Ca-activated chloride channel homolog
MSLRKTPLFLFRRSAGGCAGILLILLNVVLGPDLKAQTDKPREPDEVIKVYSNLVNIPVIISGRDGRYVAGLTQEDFKLYDNNTEQKLAFFDTTEAPLNVALLLDTSRSTAGVIDDIRKAAKSFLKNLRPQDRAMVVSFDYAIHKLSPMTSDRKVLERAIKEARVGEPIGTMLDDALIDVIQNDLKPINGRKAIVLLTDGEDAGSRWDAEDVLSAATESDTMIYPIYYAQEFPFRPSHGIFGGRGKRRNRFPRQHGQGPRAIRNEREGEFAIDFLTQLAEVSAGRFYRSEKTDLKQTFLLIADELRYQYRLGFYPDERARDGAIHQLQIKVDHPEYAVRARTQYRATTHPQ